MPLTVRAAGALAAALALSACGAWHPAHRAGRLGARLTGSVPRTAAQQRGAHRFDARHPGSAFGTGGPQPVRQVRPVRPTGLIADLPSKAGLPSGFVLGTVALNLGAFDRAIHQRANLRVLFAQIGSANFPGAAIIRNAQQGAETVIELQPRNVTLAQIAAGAEDTWLQNTFAPDVVALSRAVVLSFAPEMNGQWYPWGHGRVSPTQFVQAWRHVHDVLAATAAAPYVSWFWQPSAIHITTPSPVPYWPGSNYVDEVGLDGYYIFPTDNFGTIFGKTLGLIRSLTTKPIIIGETAVGPLTARLAADVADLFAGIRRNHLSGMVWFNIPQNRGLYHQDWRLQDHPLALDAFISQLAAAGV